MRTEDTARILIVDDDSLTASWLRALFEKANYAVESTRSAVEALALFRAQSFNFVVLDRLLPDLDGLDLCRQLREEPGGGDVWIILLSIKASHEDIVEGLRAGADDYISKRRGADAELLAKIKMMALRQRQEAKAPDADVAGHGQIISFFSAKGGIGTTTLAVNSAYSLRRLLPRASILLVDMVFPLGSVERMIGAESAGTIAQLSHDVLHRMDRKLIAHALGRHREYGISLLSSANDLQAAQNVEVAQIAPLFKTLRAMFDFIVVDFGRSLSRLTLPVLETSDLIFVIVSPDVNAVALSRVALDYLLALQIPRQRLVVLQNRTVPRSWLSREDIEKELGLPVALTIPYDGEQMTLATNAHKLYLDLYDNTTTSSTLAAMGRLIADRLAAQTPQPSEAILQR
jgi:pilus assembly protein CpaE